MATIFAIGAFIMFTFTLIRINQIGDRCWRYRDETSEIKRMAGANQERIGHIEDDVKKIKAKIFN